MTDITVTIAPTVQFNCSVTVGAVGPGVASGGTTAQVLRKASNTSYDTEWHTLAKADVGLTNVDDTSDLDKPVSTAQAAAIEAAAVGLFDDRGAYDASVNTYPAAGGSGTAGAVLKGDIWTVSVAGTLGGATVTAGDTVRALVDTPGQTASNWAIAETNIGFVPEPAIAAGTTAQYWRGDKSWRDFATDVRATLATGLSLATSQVIAATDTVILALGYLQAQITAIGVANSTAVKTALNASGSAPIYACRAWVDYNGATNAVVASGNISTVTDNGTGLFTLNFDTAIQDANYSIGQCCGNTTGSTISVFGAKLVSPDTLKLAGSCRIAVISNDAATSTFVDLSDITFSIFR